MIAAIIVIVIIIKSTLDGALVKKNLQSIYIKILMNHLQLILLSASFDFDWPDNVNEFYDTTRPASQVSSQILSFDCFIDQRSESSDSSESSDLYFKKMIMYAFLPLGIMLASLTFWSAFYLCKTSSDKSKIKGRIIATIIILLFLIHPSIVQFMFNSFNCTEIDNELRMTQDLNIV